MARSGRTHNYLAGLFAGQITRCAGVLVSLWLTPFVLQFLDRAAYGLFALALSVITWLAVADLGTSPGLQVHLARLSGSSQPEKTSRYVSSTFLVQMGLAALVLGVGGFVAAGFASFFAIRPDLQLQLELLIGLLAVGTAITLATKSFQAILIAHQRVDLDSINRFVSLAARAGLTVVFLLTGYGVISLALAHVIASVAAATLAIRQAYRLVPELSVRFGEVSWQTLRKVGTTGIWFSLGGLGGLLIVGLDRAVAAKMISLEAVTVLFLTQRLYALAESVLSPVVNTARAGLGQLLGAGQKLRAERVYHRLLTLSAALGIVAAMSVWAGNQAFVSAWVGQTNYGGSLLDLALAGNLVVSLWILPNRATLASGLVVRPPVLCRLVEAGFKVALAVILTWKFGLLGVALSTSLAAALTSCWYLPRLVELMFAKPSFSFVSIVGLRLVLLSAVLGPFAFGLRVLAGQFNGYLAAALASATTLLAGLGLVWVLVLDRQLRAKAGHLIAEFTRPQTLSWMRRRWQNSTV